MSWNGAEGFHKPGLEINLPFSKQMGDIYWHWNAGLTWLPSVDALSPGGDSASLERPFIAGSAIFRLKPMFHLMLESVLQSVEARTVDGTTRADVFTLSPGARGGWNIGDHQLVVGFAVPVTWDEERTDDGRLLLYCRTSFPSSARRALAVRGKR